MITPNLSSYDFDALWRKALDLVFHEGRESSPREQKTRELLGLQLRLEDARANVLTNETRALNYRFLVAEWLWILGGLDDVATIARYNSQIAQFSDDGLTFAGAYGPRLVLHQLPWVIEQLRSKPDTRQAVVMIWLPRPHASRDIPCTLTFQWLLRNGCLHCVTTMRSSDLWLGLPYDTFNFTQLTNAIAAELHVEVGSFVLNLGSAHLYERDWPKVELVLADPESYESIVSPHLRHLPTPELCVRVLRNPESHALTGKTDPLFYYERALAVKTSAQAKEVLLAASQLR